MLVLTKHLTFKTHMLIKFHSVKLGIGVMFYTKLKLKFIFCIQ